MKTLNTFKCNLSEFLRAVHALFKGAAGVWVSYLSATQVHLPLTAVGIWWIILSVMALLAGAHQILWWDEQN